MVALSQKANCCADFLVTKPLLNPQQTMKHYYHTSASFSWQKLLLDELCRNIKLYLAGVRDDNIKSSWGKKGEHSRTPVHHFGNCGSNLLPGGKENEVQPTFSLPPTHCTYIVEKILSTPLFLVFVLLFLFLGGRKMTDDKLILFLCYF